MEHRVGQRGQLLCLETSPDDGHGQRAHLVIGQVTFDIQRDEGAPIVRADGPTVALRFDEAGDV